MSSPNEARTWRTPGCFKDFQSFQSCAHAAEGWNTPILCSVWNRMFLSWFSSACFMQKLCPWTCSLFLSKKTRLLCGVLEKKKSQILEKDPWRLFTGFSCCSHCLWCPDSYSKFLRKFLRVAKTLPVSQRWQTDLFAMMTTEVLFFSISNAKT